MLGIHIIYRLKLDHWIRKFNYVYFYIGFICIKLGCVQVNVRKSRSFQPHPPVRGGGQILPVLLPAPLPAVQHLLLGILPHLGQLERRPHGPGAGGGVVTCALEHPSILTVER